MAVLGLSQDDARKVLGELNQALFNHEQWAETINRTLACRLTPDQADLATDAHHKCRFGQWIRSPHGETLAGHPGMAEMMTAHERMHRYCRTILLSSVRSETVELQDYERFTNALKQLRIEINTIKHELEETIHSLDPLTGATKGIGMLTRLREQQDLVKRKAHSCCLAIIVVDDFKTLIEKHGAAMGDRVLAAFAHQAKDQLRLFDFLFRYGGEEFLLCLPNAHIEAGFDVVDHLRKIFADVTFEDKDGAPFHVTLSGGLTPLDADVSVEESIGRADKALYAATAAGRDRVVVWDASMTQGRQGAT